MTDRNLGSSEEIPQEKALSERREFLKKAGKVALTAPAAALLLSRANMPAHAQTAPSGTVIITNPGNLG